MPEFLDSLDIANRACQHMGISRIDSVDEDSVANNEIAFVYGKLRQAELRRNVWTFATRRIILRPVDTDTMLLDPAAWSSTATYARGALAKDDNGEIWQSTVPENLNNEPGSTSAWEKYFGPMTVTPYDEDTQYYAGELVYVEGEGNAIGSFVIFMSLTNSNEDAPDDAEAYDADTLYHRGDVASYGGYQWKSLIEVNRGITPATAPLDYDNTATYSSAQQVTASDGYIYTSTGNGNSGNDPVTDGGVHWTNTHTPRAWAKVPEIYASSPNWLPIYSGMNTMRFLYPVGAGPLSQDSTRNVYKLPAGFLRRAPQDPKAGNIPYLGAPGGRVIEDWVFENGFLITNDVRPIAFRFVADVTDVSKMDPMFCEGLGARIAFEIVEKVTQSSDKKRTIAGSYGKFMSEARAMNAIEQGAEEPPEDDFITCRI